MLENNSWFVFFEKSRFFCVLKQIALSEQLSDNIYSSFCIIISYKPDDIRVMTKLKNTFFELDDLFFILREFKFLNNFHCYFFVSLLLNSTINRRKVTCSDFFHYLILVINTVFFKLLKESQPFLLCWLILKIVLLLRINTISMFYYYSCS